MKPVREAFDDAEAQLDRYRGVLQEQFGETLRLRCFTIVALGFERLVMRER